jgi:hypothetical protein
MLDTATFSQRQPRGCTIDTHIVWPPDLTDELDRAWIAELLEDETEHVCIIDTAIFIIHWTDDTGQHYYRIYNATNEPVLSQQLGLLEMAKAELIRQHNEDCNNEDDE